MTGPSDDRQKSLAELQAPSGRTRSVPHPRYTLEQVEELARRAFAMGARHCDQDAVAQAIHYKNSTNGAFKGIRAAAGYFGLVSYKDDRYVSVTEPWIEALHADDEEAVRRLRQEAVRQPELFVQLIEEFADRQLPTTEKLARQLFLTPKYGILKDAAEQAARVFLDSIRFAGLVDSNNFLRSADKAKSDESTGPQRVAEASSSPEAKPQHAATVGQTQSPSATPSVPPDSALDRIEVQLSGGRRAYLFVPVPIAAREKERLKRYIDLILEPDDSWGGQEST